MKINYKSDFELDYTLLDEHGQPITPPDCPWKLVLSIGNPLKPYAGQCDCINGRNFVASFDGTQYKNCTVADTVIRVFADNHGLPCGQLWATFITYTPNPDFPDGNRRVYTPQATDTFLVAEAGDDPTPAQIQYTANYVVFEHEYTAGQGITIEDDVISATGESYTAGEGITIADGEIGLSQGTLDELESHDADIRDLITSVNSLERGNERAVRLTDTTTTGEAGKVVKVDETVVGTTYSRITADIFESKMVESDGGVCYAFPSSSNEVKTNADDMLLASGDKAELEEQINGKASSSDVTALANRVTTAEGSIADLTTGNNPALRTSDKTTEKTIGKVAEYDDSRDTYLDPTTHQPIPQAKVPMLNTGDLYLDGVFRAGMDNKYALPHEGDEVKLRADYVLADEADVTSLSQTVSGKADTSDVSALDERVVVVETALPTKASTSSVNAIDGRVTTLENTYEDTMNIANNQLHELIDGKAMMAAALTDRGYPTQPTDSSASMAQKIENMAYDAGWLAQLGYSETNDGGVKDAVAYSKAIKDGWNPSEITRLFTSDYNLCYFPDVDTSQYTSMYKMFEECFSLVSVISLDTSNCANAGNLFYKCYSLKYIPPLDLGMATDIQRLIANCYNLESIIFRDTHNVTTMGTAFGNVFSLKRMENLDVSSCTTFTSMFWVEPPHELNIEYLTMLNIGKVQNKLCFDNASIQNLKRWGANSEENRMSLVRSLRDYSYDRVTAGYSTFTVRLHADALARLTAEEIAAITAKGYTLTS